MGDTPHSPDAIWEGTGSELGTPIWFFPCSPTVTFQGLDPRPCCSQGHWPAILPCCWSYRGLSAILEVSPVPKHQRENPGPTGSNQKTDISFFHTERPVPWSGGVKCEEKEILLLPHKATLPREHKGYFVRVRLQRGWSLERAPP